MRAPGAVGVCERRAYVSGVVCRFVALSNFSRTVPSGTEGRMLARVFAERQILAALRDHRFFLPAPGRQPRITRMPVPRAFSLSTSAGDAYGSSEDITKLEPRSVFSGRSLSEIARMSQTRMTSRGAEEGEG